MSFVNRVAVVTGASSGIGWCLAKRLAAGGAEGQDERGEEGLGETGRHFYIVSSKTTS